MTTTETIAEFVIGFLFLATMIACLWVSLIIF